MRRSRPSWFGPLFITMLIGASVGSVRHFTRPPLYEARVEVQPPSEAAFAEASSPALAAASQDDPEDLVFAPTVLSAAVQRLRQKQIAPFDRLDVGAATSELSSSLRLAMRSDSPNIVVACTSPNSDHALTRLQAWADAWLETHCGPDLNARPAPAKPTDMEAVRHRAAELHRELGSQQEQIASLEEQFGGHSDELARDLVQQEKLKALAVTAATATARRLEAENRFVQIRRDLESGITVELLLPRLPDGPARQAVEAVVSQTRMLAEQDQLRAERKRLSKVYGLRHPRIAEIDDRLAAPEFVQARTTERYASVFDLPRTPARCLLNALESDLQEQQAIEQDLQNQLDLELDAQDQRTAQAAQLRDAIRHANELEMELDKLTATPAAPRAKQIAANSLTAIVRPPELLPFPVRRLKPSLIEATATAFCVWIAWVGLTSLRRRRFDAPERSHRPMAVVTVKQTPLQERRAERMLRLRLNRLRTG